MPIRFAFALATSLGFLLSGCSSTVPSGAELTGAYNAGYDNGVKLQSDGGRPTGTPEVDSALAASCAMNANQSSFSDGDWGSPLSPAEEVYYQACQHGAFGKPRLESPDAIVALAGP